LCQARTLFPRQRRALELGHCAAERDLAGAGVNEAERDQPAEPPTLLRFDDKVGNDPSDRIDDHTAHLATGAVAAADFRSDRELSGLGATFAWPSVGVRVMTRP